MRRACNDRYRTAASGTSVKPLPVLIYTAPGCPDCAALKQWLQQRHSVYEERDVTHPGVADEAKSRYGVRVAPITVIGDDFFFGTFAQQKAKLETAFDQRD